MKIRKMQTKLLFAALLMATTVAVSGCGGETNPTETTPGTSGESADVTGDISGTETEAPAEINVSFSVKDQKGNVIADASIIITELNSENAPRMLKTDTDGAASVALFVGNYSIELINLPEYHLFGTTTLTVAEGMDTVSLTVRNNTPDGSEEHPFFFSENSATFTFAADTTYYYNVFGGGSRTLVIHNPDVEVTYDGKAYLPDETGTVRVPLVVNNMQNLVVYSIKSTKAQDVVITIEAEPGSMDNPFTAETGKDIVADVPKDGSVNYTYTATQSGRLVLTTADSINNISMTNTNTYKTTNFSNGSTEPITLEVNAGDVISITVSTVGGDTSLASQNVTFRLSEEPS